jgi:allantoicase
MKSTPLPDFVKSCANLASPRLGSGIAEVSDAFFAPAERMIEDGDAVFIPGKYDDHGKWMDGWESRRKRGPGHDHCVIRLGGAGVIRAVDIDTSYFTGNYPPAASIEGCRVEGVPDDATVWSEIVPSTTLGPDAHHYAVVDDGQAYNFVRLNIYPDGGVARLRIYGHPVPRWDGNDTETRHELSALTNGGRIVDCNDDHYGGTWKILTDGRGINAGDGWETRRRREPGNDWIIVELGAVGIIDGFEVDTAHFKGNYPDRCSVQAALCKTGTDEFLATQSMFWEEIMAPQELGADAVHRFDSADLNAFGPVSHVKLNIHPDGGVSRFRVFGRLAK